MQPFDTNAMSELADIRNKICQDYLIDPKAETIFIPAELWAKYGGHPNKLPAAVSLVYGLNKPTTNKKVADGLRRTFLINNLATPTQRLPRVHMAHHFIDQNQKAKYHRGFSYCGSLHTGEQTTGHLFEVTCPECLMWIRKVNTTH